MPLDRFTVDDRLPPDRVERVIKIVILGVAAMAFVWTLARLPGVDWLLPEAAVRTRDLMQLVIGGAIAAVLAAFAGQAYHLVVAVLDAPDPLVDHVAAICRWTLFLVTVLVAHWAGVPVIDGLVPALRPVYDLLVLGLSAALLLIIAGRVWVAADPAAVHVAERLTADE